MSASDPPRPFEDADVIATLSGFSGARVALMQSRGGKARFIRKWVETSADVAGLVDQTVRMRVLANVFTGEVAVPRLIGEGRDDRRWWYDMDHVQGIDGVTFLGHATVDRAERYRRTVLAIWRALREGPPPLPVDHDLTAVVRDKLASIGARTSGRFSTLLASIEQRADRLSIRLATSPSHGDLTLENMIFDSAGRVFLIDPIPSPIEHHWFDIAKVFQDMEGRWFVHRRRRLPLGITAGIRDRLGRDLAAADPAYLEAHPVMLALCFARILPYCRTARDTEFVCDRIRLSLASTLGTQDWKSS